MPRQERTKSGTGIYHVMLRGINKQDMFEDDEDYLQMTSIKTKMITEPSLGHLCLKHYCELQIIKSKLKTGCQYPLSSLIRRMMLMEI